MNRKITALAFLLFSFMHAFAFSDVPEGAVITEIRFEGLKRTKESFMQQEFSKYIGRPATAENLASAELDLRVEGIFSEMSASYSPISDTQARMDIAVQEKLTLLPIPFAMYTSSTGFMGGFFVTDMNMLGRKDMLMLGGLFSRNTIMGMGSFSRPARGNKLGFSTFVSVKKTEEEITNLDADTLLEYESFAISSNFKVHKKIGDYNTASVGIFVNLFETDDVFKPIQLDTYFVGGGSLGWRFSKSDYNGYFLSTLDLSASGTIGYANLENADFRTPITVSYAASYQKPIVPKLRVAAAAQGHIGFHTAIDAHQGRGAAGATILDGNFRTERIFGEKIGAEYALCKASFGVVSAYANWEFVTAEDADGDYAFCTGPHGGIRLYLAKIAFPALSVGGSYNITKKQGQFAASFGMSF